MTSTDARIGATVEHGFAGEAVLRLRALSPSLTITRSPASSPLRERWVPVTSEVQTDLLPLVRSLLRPASTRFPTPPGVAAVGEANSTTLSVARTRAPGR